MYLTKVIEMKIRVIILISVVSGFAFLSACKHESLFDPTLPTVTVECDPDTVYFRNDIYPLIISNCAMSGCHDGNGEEDAEDLTSYEAIMNSDYVDPYNANESELIDKVNENDPDDIMPPPPAEPLTSAQIALLQTWINQGAKNNECAGGDCDTTNVSYTGTIAVIMETYCNGCHSGGSPSGGIDLTSYAGVAAIAADGSLLGSVMHESGFVAMPYAADMLPDCKIDEIRIWVNDNYPNN